MSRLLHEPTIRLRSLGGERGHASLELVRELFGLQEDAPGAETQGTELAEVHDLPVPERAARAGEDAPRRARRHRER